MAKWHKVVINGVARYRSSASKSYVSYNVAKDSWSSKMLPGNMPVEQLAKAPKVIKVKGSAWGVEVVRSYMEGERPVTHILAYRGRGEQFSGWGADRKVIEPANPAYVYFGFYSAIELHRADSEQQLARDKSRIGVPAKDKYSCAADYNDVMIVELS